LGKKVEEDEFNLKRLQKELSGMRVQKDKTKIENEEWRRSYKEQERWTNQKRLQMWKENNEVWGQNLKNEAEIERLRNEQRKTEEELRYWKDNNDRMTRNGGVILREDKIEGVNVGARSRREKEAMESGVKVSGDKQRKTEEEIKYWKYKCERMLRKDEIETKRGKARYQKKEGRGIQMERISQGMRNKNVRFCHFWNNGWCRF